MRDAIKLFRRFLPPYKTYVILGVVSNILAAIFSIFTYLALIPLLKILFRIDTNVYQHVDAQISLIPFDIPRDAIMNNMYAWLGDKINTQGAIHVLLMVGIFGITIVFFKAIFTYLASFFMVKIRNHVVKDIRNNLFKKIDATFVRFCG